MIVVRLGGDLGERFGNVFNIHDKTPARALKAILSQIPKLEERMKKGFYRVVWKGVTISENEAKETLTFPTGGGVLEITPVAMGAGAKGAQGAMIGLTVVGGLVMVGLAIASVFFPPAAALLGAVSLTPMMAGLMGGAMAIGGIVTAITMSKDQTTDENESAERRASNFSDLANISTQGVPVPVIYGEMLVGSVVVSNGVTTSSEKLSAIGLDYISGDSA